MDIELWWLSSHPIPPTYLYSGKGSSPPGCVPLDDIMDSVVDIESGDSGVVVVIGYQVDEFTYPWLAECFVV